MALPHVLRVRLPHFKFLINYDLFSLDRYNLYNLAHHHADFNFQATWTYSATGHGKGPCDGLGVVVKSTATEYLLKGGPNVSFSTPKEFFEWCLKKTDRMVIARPRRINTSNNASNCIPEPNRPIKISWLSSDIVKKEFDNLLKPRWNRLSSKGRILFR